MRDKLPWIPHFLLRAAMTIVVAAAAIAVAGTARGALIELPQTGQTACYDGAGAPVACAGTGQDGELQKGVPAPVPRFTDNGDGTVTDNLTGLVWLRDGNCFDQIPWVDAIAAARALQSGQCGLTDGSVAGNWRLPNIVELESLVDLGRVGPALPAGHPFLNLEPAGYWSSTSNGFHPLRARFVYLPNGTVNGSEKINTQFVWPVRGGR